MNYDMKYTTAYLKELQSLPLERKVGMTAARLEEWITHWGGLDNVYISFSGGKDSTVLAYIARALYPDIKLAFCDTGMEYPEIRSYVKKFNNVDWIKPKMKFMDVIKEYGYPIISKSIAQRVFEAKKKLTGWGGYVLGLHNDNRYKNNQIRTPQWGFLVGAPFKISHYCCNIMKKKPFIEYEKQTGRRPILGTMAEESYRRTTAWRHTGCNGFDMLRPSSKPMAFWTSQDVLKYIQIKGIEICSVYGDIVENKKGKLTTTGEERTGCMFCAFGTHLDKAPNKFQRMAITHPAHWRFCMNKLGMAEVLDYIHVPYNPVYDIFNYKSSIDKKDK